MSVTSEKSSTRRVSSTTKKTAGRRLSKHKRSRSVKRKRSTAKTTGEPSQEVLGVGAPRSPLDVLLNLNTAQTRTPRRLRLPILPDPYEEPCIETDSMPDGYVFVAKGNVYITRSCKSHSKGCADTVYIVYDRQGKRQLGIRVREGVYQHVKGMEEKTAEDRAEAVRIRDERTEKKARKLLEEEFPAMPPGSREAILSHAFLKGSGRVGRSTTIETDEHKATLAVEAHIRHVHTPYEKLLESGMDRKKAREAVWDTVQNMRNHWSGKEPGESITMKKKKTKK